MANSIEAPLGFPQTHAELLQRFDSRELDPEKNVFFIGRGNIPLGEKVGELLGLPVTMPLSTFRDGETQVNLGDVEGKQVVFLNSGQPVPDTRAMETFKMIDTAKRDGADHIQTMWSYFPDARGDKTEARGSSAGVAFTANAQAWAGANQLHAVEIHARQSGLVVPIPFRLHSASPVIAQAIRDRHDIENIVLAAPDATAEKRAQEIATELGINRVAIVTKGRDHRRPDESNVRGRAGSEVRGAKVIIIDDIGNTGGTLTHAAEYFLNEGGKEVYAAVVHPVFPQDDEGRTFPERMQEKGHPLSGLITTDSIQRSDIDEKDIETLAPLIALQLYASLLKWQR